MSSNRKTLPFVSQENDGYCGAACLAMIYQAVGIPENLENIWKAVSIPWPGVNGMFSGLAAMQKHALEKGLHCITLAFKDLDAGLQFCDEHGIFAIIQMHAHKNYVTGHFVLYVCTDWIYYFINDPGLPEGSSRRIKKTELQELTKVIKPERDIKCSNTVVLIAHPSDTLRVTKGACHACGEHLVWFDDLPQESIDGYLCHKCRRFDGQDGTWYHRKG